MFTFVQVVETKYLLTRNNCRKSRKNFCSTILSTHTVRCSWNIVMFIFSWLWSARMRSRRCLQLLVCLEGGGCLPKNALLTLKKWWDSSLYIWRLMSMDMIFKTMSIPFFIFANLILDLIVDVLEVHLIFFLHTPSLVYNLFWMCVVNHTLMGVLYQEHVSRNM